MTVKEVSAAVGAPPGNYRATGRVTAEDLGDGGWEAEECAELGRSGGEVTLEEWVGARGSIHVYFDEEGRAAEKAFCPLRPRPRCPFLAFCRERLPSWGK
jgi:hypothetical protein